jgi:predicted amino acid racemase
VFVDATLRRNRPLIEAAVDLHRADRIPSNCYVIDVDMVAANARCVATAAAEAGLQTLQMTKQFGRNPLVATAVAENGIDAVVAVDFEEARLLHHHGLPLGHVGHLVQVPKAEAERVIDIAPALITVFGVEQARRLAEAARAANREQALLIRVVADGDTFYPAQVGGVRLDELVDAAQAIVRFDGVTIAGVTSFPCILWNEQTQQLEPTQNLQTLEHATGLLRDAGFAAPVVNAPSASCSATVGLLASNGATLVEPGSCLTGHTPLHAVTDQPEVPAMVYVSEVTHQLDGLTYTLGGGLYPRSRARKALIYGDSDDLRVAEVRLDAAEAIDYYGCLEVDPAAAKIGDTVVYAFRSQVFVARSFVAVLADVKSSPRVLGIFNSTGFGLDEQLLPTSQLTPASGT